MGNSLGHGRGEHDSFLVVFPLPAGAYLVNIDDVERSHVGRYDLLMSTFARLSSLDLSSEMKWDQIEPAGFHTTLVSGEGRTGMWLRRLSTAMEVPGLSWRNPQPYVEFDVRNLDGLQFACRFEAVGDGHMMVDFADPKDKKTLAKWREDGACPTSS